MPYVFVTSKKIVHEINVLITFDIKNFYRSPFSFLWILRAWWAYSSKLNYSLIFQTKAFCFHVSKMSSLLSWRVFVLSQRILSSRRTNQNEDLNTVIVLLNPLMMVQFLVVNFSMHAESDYTDVYCLDGVVVLEASQSSSVTDTAPICLCSSKMKMQFVPEVHKIVECFDHL